MQFPDRTEHDLNESLPEISTVINGDIFCVRVLVPEDGLDEQIYAMTQKIGRDENRFNNEPYGMTRGEFAQWCIKQDAWSGGEMLPPGYVRQWTFWLYVNHVPAGYGRLRERLTEQSKLFGGNIGYAIANNFRGKGYGTYLFDALLKFACLLKLEAVLSTVEKCNPASKAVHEKCGGVLISENSDRWFFSFDEAMKKIKESK